MTTPGTTPKQKPAWRRRAWTAAIVAFAGLFVLGRARGDWLPFWIVATFGAVLFAIIMVATAAREVARKQPRGARAWAETALLVAVAAYSFWISIGHLTEELAHI